MFAFLLPNLANGQGSSDVIYVQVGVERSKVCGGRAYAESAARLELVNKASKMCGQVTPGRWVLNRKAMDREDHGLMVCDRCKNDPGQYSCSILGSRFPCVNLEKKKPEKPKEAEAESAKAREQAGKDGRDGSGQKKDPADGRPADPNQKPEPKKDVKPGPNPGGNTKPQDQPIKGGMSAGQNKDPGKGSLNDKYKAPCERVNDTGGTGLGSRPGDSVCGPSKGSGDGPAKAQPNKPGDVARDPKDIAAAAINKAFGETDKSNPNPRRKSMDEGFADVDKYWAAEVERKREEAKQILQSIRINSHLPNSRVFTRVVDLRGDTSGKLRNTSLDIHFNDAVQQVMTDGTGSFSSKIVLKPGKNDIKVCHPVGCVPIQLLAEVEKLGLMATLTWEGTGDLDLHLVAPSGERCSYRSRLQKGVCQLDIDDTRGVNPENISVPESAPRGTYRFSVINFSGVSGVRGTLKVYWKETLHRTEHFRAGGSKGAEEASVSASLF